MPGCDSASRPRCSHPSSSEALTQRRTRAPTKSDRITPSFAAAAAAAAAMSSDSAVRSLLLLVPADLWPSVFRCLALRDCGRLSQCNRAVHSLADVPANYPTPTPLPDFDNGFDLSEYRRWQSARRPLRLSMPQLLTASRSVVYRHASDVHLHTPELTVPAEKADAMTAEYRSAAARFSHVRLLRLEPGTSDLSGGVRYGHHDHAPLLAVLTQWAPKLESFTMKFDPLVSRVLATEESSSIALLRECIPRMTSLKHALVIKMCDEPRTLATRLSLLDAFPFASGGGTLEIVGPVASSELDEHAFQSMRARNVVRSIDWIAQAQGRDMLTVTPEQERVAPPIRSTEHAFDAEKLTAALAASHKAAPAAQLLSLAWRSVVDHAPQGSGDSMLEPDAVVRADVSAVQAALEPFRSRLNELAYTADLSTVAAPRTPAGSLPLLMHTLLAAGSEHAWPKLQRLQLKLKRALTTPYGHYSFTPEQTLALQRALPALRELDLEGVLPQLLSLPQGGGVFAQLETLAIVFESSKWDAPMPSLRGYIESIALNMRRLRSLRIGVSLHRERAAENAPTVMESLMPLLLSSSSLTRVDLHRAQFFLRLADSSAVSARAGTVWDLGRLWHSLQPSHPLPFGVRDVQSLTRPFLPLARQRTWSESPQNHPASPQSSEPVVRGGLTDSVKAAWNSLWHNADKQQSLAAERLFGQAELTEATDWAARVQAVLAPHGRRVVETRCMRFVVWDAEIKPEEDEESGGEETNAAAIFEAVAVNRLL